MRDSQKWKRVEIRPVQQFSRSGQVRTQTLGLRPPTEQRQSLNEARHREGQTKDRDRQREEQIRDKEGAAGRDGASRHLTITTSFQIEVPLASS